MAPSTIQLAILACAGFTLVHCQRFQQGPSVVEPDYDFAEEAPQQRAQARAAGPSPALRNSILADNAVKTTTPVVAILKQINRHNEDGSYTYGYEGGDGSFKIETKLANGEVMGKYGYVDDTGKVRVIEYGANKFGFQPSGEGITVPPPNLVEEVSEEPKRGQTVGDVEFNEQIVERPRPRAPARAPAARPSAPRPQQQQQFASASFQSRDSFAPAEESSFSQNTSPVQFLPQEASPPRAAAPSFSAPQQSFSAPTFSAFLTSNDAPPPRPAPARIPSSFDSPVPQQPASFPGAAPTRPQSFASAAPVPPRPASFPGASPAGPAPESFQAQPQPQFRPRPAQAFFQPSPSFAQPSSSFAQPQFAQPQRSASRQSSSSILDQLAQDYALPQGGSRPLHDITFGAS